MPRRDPHGLPVAPPRPQIEGMDCSIGIPKGLWSRLGASRIRAPSWRCAAAGGWLFAAMGCPAALGDEPVPPGERPPLSSPLAQDIDRQRVYATGPSNGGNFTLRLACEMSTEIAAFAPVLASFPRLDTKLSK